MPSTPQTLPRDWRALWWVALVALTIIGLLAGAFYWHAQSGLADLEEAIAETDRLDPGWRGEDLLASRKVVPPEKNGALKIIESAKKVKTTGEEDTALADLFPFPPAHERQLNFEQVEALTAWIEKNAEALALARAAKDLQGGSYPVTYHPEGGWLASVDEIQALRSILYILDQDVTYQAHRKALAQAADSCLALLGACSTIGDEAGWNAFLVGMAGRNIVVDAMERVLAQGELDDAHLQLWQDRLARELRPADYLTYCRWERANSFHLVDAVRAGKIPRPRDPFGGKFECSASAQAALLRWMNHQVEVAKKPSHEIHQAARHEAPDLRDRTDLVGLFSGGMGKPRESFVRVVALFECMQAAAAAERYRLKHRSWPETWEPLVKEGLLKDTPIDPFDGKPLRLKRTETGLVIYSVYKNGTDEEGEFEYRGSEEKDIGVRLWNPLERRAAPLPPRPKAEDMPPDAP